MESSRASECKTLTEFASTSSAPEGPVDRAFHLLQVLVAAGEPLGVRELGRRTGLPRSTASRLVSTLERLGMIERTADGSAAPGGALATLQTSTTQELLLRDRLRPLLTELVNTFGENAALAVDDGDALLYVAQVKGENPVSAGDVDGERHPFHLVAPGLVTMAHWPADRLREHLSGPLTPATDHSVTRPPALKRRLKQITANGWAWTNQELDLGINGLAVPVFGDDASSTRELTATLSLYGPSYRFSPEARPTLAEDLANLVSTRTAL